MVPNFKNVTMVPVIWCQTLRRRSPSHFTWRASRSRDGRSKLGRVGSSRSRRQVILSRNAIAVSRSSHGFFLWPGRGVCWRFLQHPPHLSAFCLPRVTPRNGVVCHVIILRNACIYIRPGLKPQTRRSSTWITSSFWPCFFFLTFSLRRGVLL